MTKEIIKQQLVNCYIDFNKTELKGACQGTQLQITRFFQVIMREIEQMDISENN